MVKVDTSVYGIMILVIKLWFSWWHLSLVGFQWTCCFFMALRNSNPLCCIAGRVKTFALLSALPRTFLYCFSSLILFFLWAEWCFCNAGHWSPRMDSPSLCTSCISWNGNIMWGSVSVEYLSWEFYIPEIFLFCLCGGNVIFFPISSDNFAVRGNTQGRTVYHFYVEAV